MAHVGIAYERYEDVLCAVDLATFAESMASDHHTHTVNGSVNVRIVQIHSTNKNMLCSPYSFTLFPLKSKYIFLKINRIILYGCGIFCFFCRLQKLLLLFVLFVQFDSLQV